MKPIHRLIVTSARLPHGIHRDGPNDPNLGRDPDNVYYWRMNPRRMEAEAVRDNLLHVAGNLDQARGRARPRSRDRLEIDRAAACTSGMPRRSGWCSCGSSTRPT